jgi:hypothetical protein
LPLTSQTTLLLPLAAAAAVVVVAAAVVAAAAAGVVVLEVTRLVTSAISRNVQIIWQHGTMQRESNELVKITADTTAT